MFAIFHQSDGGRTSRRHIAPRTLPARRKRAAVRAFQLILGRRSRNRRPCGERSSLAAAAPPVEGYGFTPETIASPLRSAAHFLQETPVTAYLISLALAGLIAIVIWDAL